MRSLLVLMIASFACVCNLQAIKIKYQINGHADTQYNGDTVMLFVFQGEDIQQVDTGFIQNGAFSFQGLTDTIRFAIITSGNYPNRVLHSRFIIENGMINVQLDTLSRIGGTPLNNVYNKFLVQADSMQSEIDRIHNQMEVDSLFRKNNAENYGKCWNRFFELEKSFLIENICNPLGIILFKEKYEHMNWYMFDDVYSHADNQLINDPEVRKFVRWREKQTEREKEIQNERNEVIGKKYTNFSFRTIDGKNVALSNYVLKANYLLLDFWASWCAPCMVEQTLIKKLYQKYKSKGLEVLGISLDYNESSWKNAIKKIQSDWPQVLDLKGGDSGIKDAYKFKGIPYTVLIGSDGIVKVVALRGQWLEQYVDNIFTQNK